MKTTELTSLNIHEMIHNVLQYSKDTKLIRNICEALEDRNYKSIFQTYESEITLFNQQYINIKNIKKWKKEQRKRLLKSKV